MEIFTMADEGYYMSEKTYNEFKEKLSFLKGQKRDEIIRRIDTARGFGDLSENAEYDEARREQRENEAEIVRCEDIIEKAIIYSVSGLTCKTVELGTVANVLCMWNNKQIDYSLVGSVEVDPFKYKISNDSPLGQVLIGRSVGDCVEVQAPAGIRQYKILEIKLPQ